MSRLAESFNRTGFSRFLNSPAGRVFRVVVGLGFIVVGFIFRTHALGIVSMIWGIFPLSAGVFDICYVSALLGGPISGAKIRGRHKTD
jgi:hypothetical protein